MELKKNPFGRSRYLGRLMSVGSLFLSLVLFLVINNSVQARPLAGELVVHVDGRAVGVSPQIQAELNGKQASLDEVLAVLGPDIVTAGQVQIVIPPDTELPVDGVGATIEGKEIDVSGLTQTLAIHGRIGIWISGATATGGTWRICIIITWDNANFPVVIVDDRSVKMDGVEARIDSVDVDYSDVLALLGNEVFTPTLEFFDPTTDASTPFTPTGVVGTVQANHMEFTGLANELAARGRIGIWISSRNWRICIIISWDRRANPHVLVDGSEAKVDGLEAEVSGEKVDYGRVLALLGNEVFTPTLEFFDPTTDASTPFTPTGVVGTVQANHIEFTGLASELAARGKIGIWISGKNWRICIIIVWDRRANPHVLVDGREAKVDGLEAEVNGEKVEYGRVLALLGDEVYTPTLEFFDPITPTQALLLPAVQSIVQANRMEFTGLANELAARGRIGIWISGKNWRICVIIVWDRRANPHVLVDGREAKVDGLEAEINGEKVEYGRVLALLGDEVYTPTLEFFDPVPGTPLTITGVVGTVQANHIEFTGLANELAARGRIGIWISGKNWRICVIIVWDRRANPHVLVDGREVKVDGLEAEVDGQSADYGRVLAILGDEVVTPTLTFFDPTTDASTPFTPTGVVGTVQANHIELTGLANELAARGRIGIWISGKNWRICIIIVWDRRANPHVFVDGREVKVDGLEAEVNGEKVEYGRVLALLGDEVYTPTLEFFDPITPTQALLLPAVQAIVQANRIELTGLSHELAARGRIGIWISSKNWRICIIIVWDRRANPHVLVDGREVKVDGLEAEIDGESADYRRVLALLGDEVFTPTLEFFDPVPGTPLTITGVVGTVQANHIELTGLSHELAARGRIGIWISGKNWRICIIIVWDRRANPHVLVDGREVKLDGLEAEVNGEKVEYGRVLALLGDEVYTPTLEFFDPITPTQALLLPAVQAIVQANRMEFTGLANELAARGRIGIWVSGKNWRICIVIVWDRRANPHVFVDGREVKVDGLEARVDGEIAEYGRVLALLGDEVFTPTLEFFDPATPSIPLTITDVVGTVQANRIRFIGLSDELALHRSIGIWISYKGVRIICIIISWDRHVNPQVMVDNREVRVDGLEAEVNGQSADYDRVLSLLGNEVYTPTLEFFDPVPGTPLTITGVVGTVQANRIRLTGLSNELALHRSIGVWIIWRNWRVCVILSLGTDNNARVAVDGRSVTAYRAEAEMDGQDVEPRQLFALLSGGPVNAEKVEVVDRNGLSLPADNVTAVVNGDRIRLTNLTDTLTTHRQIGVWISGTTLGVKWRVCVVIVLGKFASNDERVSLDFAASDIHTELLVTYTSITTPTAAPPSNTGMVHSFQLDAASEDGTPVLHFDKPYTLTVHYTDEGLAAAGITEETLQLAYWDEDQHNWIPIPTTVDADNNVAIGILDHLTEFVLWGDKFETPQAKQIYLPLTQK